MNKEIKRFLAIVMVVCVICMSTPRAMASEILTDKFREIIISYVEDMVPFVFENVTTEDSVYLGSPLAVYNLDDSRSLSVSENKSLPLFVNGDLAGIVDVSWVNGEVSQVNLGIKYAPELQQYLMQEQITEFAIVHCLDGVYVLSPNCNVLVCLVNYLNNDNLIDDQLEGAYEYRSLIMEDKLSINQPIKSRTIYSKKYDVSVVDNQSTTCCPNGICWAASLAMMSNFLKGTSYTALQIHNEFGCLDKNSDYHYQETDRIDDLGMTSGGPYNWSSAVPFTYANVKHYIDMEALLLLDLQGSVAHNIVCNGYYWNSTSNTTFFFYVDPNSGNGMQCFPATANTQVTFTLGDYNYYVHCFITAYE